MQSKIRSQVIHSLGTQVRGANHATLFCWPSDNKVGVVMFSDVLVC